MTELWFRNTDRALAVCAQEGVQRLTWTRQHLARLKNNGINNVRQFYIHTAVRPKIRIIGIQGTSDYDMFSRIEEPKAVYPTWSGKNDTFEDLKRLIEEPWGEDKKKCEDLSIPSGIRPVYGQKHMIVIHNNPSSATSVGKRFWNSVAQVQDENPEVEFFVNGPLSFAVLFGLKFRSCDYGLSDLGDINDKLTLPNGMRVVIGGARKSQETDIDIMMRHEDWIKLVGFQVRDIIVDQNKRFGFRIRSARWAAKHWGNNLRFFKEQYNLAPDDANKSDEEYMPPENRRIILRPKQFSTAEADKILCNRCRIQAGCRFYREDSICGLRESEMSDLSKYFDSRNAGRILDGLAQIVRVQADRVEGMLAEEAKGTEVDPNVDKALNSLFANGKSLAKLVDPTLAGPGTKVQVNVGTGGSAAVVANANPKQVMANIVEALELQGIPREKITTEMVTSVLKSMGANNQQNAIESTVVTFKDLMGENLSPQVAHPVIIDNEDMPGMPGNRNGTVEGVVVKSAPGRE